MRTVKTFTVNVRRIRDEASLSQEELAQLFRISWVTVSRWERGISAPNPTVRERLLRLNELLRHIGKALPEDELPRFLRTPQPLLRGYTPVELLQSDYSFKDLLAFVESAKSGDMA